MSFSNQEEFEPSFSSVEAGGAFGFKGESEDALVFDTSSSFFFLAVYTVVWVFCDFFLMGGDMAFGLGYMLHNKSARIEESPRYSKGYFGHAGIGGAVAYGDKDKNFGYAFLCNQEHEMRDLYKTSNQISTL